MANQMNQMEEIFQSLNDVITALARRVNSLANKVEQLEHGGGGGGNATVEDYESGKLYKRNTLLVDTATETMYRVSCQTEYTSASFGLISLISVAPPPPAP